MDKQFGMEKWINKSLRQLAVPRKGHLLNLGY